jgi:hypothetical protein
MDVSMSHTRGIGYELGQSGHTVGEDVDSGEADGDDEEGNIHNLMEEEVVNGLVGYLDSDD